MRFKNETYGGQPLPAKAAVYQGKKGGLYYWSINETKQYVKRDAPNVQMLEAAQAE